MILISFAFLGCGRFFEGTAEEMHTALNKTLAAVPDDTKVYVSPAKLEGIYFTNCISPDTSTRRQMLSLASQFCRARR
jgi:hydroxyacylglutathione hydrolase